MYKGKLQIREHYENILGNGGYVLWKRVKDCQG